MLFTIRPRATACRAFEQNMFRKVPLRRRWRQVQQSNSAGKKLARSLEAAAAAVLRHCEK
jgi:hypothetical protein